VPAEFSVHESLCPDEEAVGTASRGEGLPASNPPRTQLLRLSDEQLTLAIPLYAKALDYRSRHPILNDPWASELVGQIDFDFEKLKSPASRLLAVRARQFDEWVREFLGRNPRSVVLNLGCGLDTRVSRIRPPPSALWLDLDFPEVIELRRNFYSDQEGYRMLSSSMTDPQWLEQVPADRPGIAIADGVFAYLAEADVRTLLNRLTARWPRGEILFDVLGSRAVESGNSRLKGRSTATLKWGVDDLLEVDSMDPNLRRTDTVPLLGSTYAPSGFRLLSAFSYLFPSLRKSMRLLRYEF
jgi:O-methyltransferase involved in polyketide biosynthesis